MFSGLLTRFRAHWVAPQDIRAEIWALGGRHHGDVIRGARSELAAPGISLRRAVLLKAVIRSATVGS